MAYVTAGCRQPLPDASVEVYFDLLGDLDAPALMTAARRVVLAHPWNTFPSVAELREAAAATIAGEVTGVPWGDAWALATKTLAKLDVAYSEEHKTKILAPLDAQPLVAEAVRAFGFMALYNLPSDQLETARAQFRSIYEGLQRREQSRRLLPASVKQAIAAIGHEQPTNPTVKMIAAEIGKEKP